MFFFFIIDQWNLPAISLVVSRIVGIETIFHASSIFLIVGFPTFLHVLDVSVNNSSEDIHYKTQYVQRVELKLRQKWRSQQQSEWQILRPPPYSWSERNTLQHRETEPRSEHSPRLSGWWKPDWSPAGPRWEPPPPGEVLPWSWRLSGILEVYCSC